jgi:hypothetical protein
MGMQVFTGLDSACAGVCWTVGVQVFNGLDSACAGVYWTGQWVCRCLLDSTVQTQGPVKSSNKHHNEPSDSINGRNYFLTKK